MLRQFCLIASLAAVYCLHPRAATAHPMGNFSVSHYARFDVGEGGVRLTYVLDLAELPTFDLVQKWNLDGRDFAAIEREARRHASDWLTRLDVRVDGVTVPLKLQRTRAEVSDGAGGLPVLRVLLSAAVSREPGLVEYEDHNYPERAGWKEIVIAVQEGSEITPPHTSMYERSRELTAYPADATVAPPQDVRISFRVRTPHPAAPRISTGPVAGPTVATEAAGAAPVSRTPTFAEQQQPKSGALTRGDLLSQILRQQNLTVSIIVLGLCAAFGLGALHALSPGHGKTIVAAYLVGSRATLRHAVILGATVTFTHTVSVFLLGLAIILFEDSINADRAIPLLGVLSGVSIVVIGGLLLRSRLRMFRGGEEGLADGAHDHGFGVHVHLPVIGGNYESQFKPGTLSMPGLIALGVSGGLVPCPSALVLLLSAAAMGRVALGLMLLTAFSAGLSIVLVALGAVAIYGKRLFLSSPTSSFVQRFAPLCSAVVVVIVGCLMTAVSLGWVRLAPFLT